MNKTRLSLVAILAGGIGLSGCNTTDAPYWTTPQGLAGVALKGNALVNQELTPEQGVIMGVSGDLMLTDAQMQAQAEDLLKATQAGAPRVEQRMEVVYPNTNNGNNTQLVDRNVKEETIMNNNKTWYLIPGKRYDFEFEGGINIIGAKYIERDHGRIHRLEVRGKPMVFGSSSVINISPHKD